MVAKTLEGYGDLSGGRQTLTLTKNCIQVWAVSHHTLPWDMGKDHGTLDGTAQGLVSKSQQAESLAKATLVPIPSTSEEEETKVPHSPGRVGPPPS